MFFKKKKYNVFQDIEESNDDSKIAIDSVRRQYEYNLVKSHDKKFINENDDWYIISSEWLKSWTLYVTNNGELPKKINNSILIVNNLPKPGLMAGKDYRGINKNVWELLNSWYGCDIVIKRKKLDIYDLSTI